jgi:hypothetical protein
MQAQCGVRRAACAITANITINHQYHKSSRLWQPRAQQCKLPVTMRQLNLTSLCAVKPLAGIQTHPQHITSMLTAA